MTPNTFLTLIAAVLVIAGIILMAATTSTVLGATLVIVGPSFFVWTAVRHA